MSSKLRCLKKGMFLVLGLLIIASCEEKDSGYYSEEDFYTVDKIDAHMHVSTQRGVFEEQAQKDNFQLLNIVVAGSRSRDQIKQQFELRMGQREKFPDMYEVATSFSIKEWDEKDWVARTLGRLDEDIDQGAVAVKVWKNIGMEFRDANGELVMVDDPRLDSIFNHLTKRKVPVIGHLGEPKNCWLPIDQMTVENDKGYFRKHPQYHMYKYPELPSYQDQLDARDRMLEKHPELIFVGAHMASMEWSVDELSKQLDRFPKMSVDIAARIGQIFHQTIEDREKVRDFFIKYQDRILYATDLGDGGKDSPEELTKRIHETWVSDWKFFVTDDQMLSKLVGEEFQGLKLPKEVVDKIYFENAIKWLNMFPGETAN